MINGKVWKYGENINTDVLFPGKYTYTVLDPKEMAKYALEDLDPEFAKNVQPGDIIVAGKNFGCGSSREQAVIALKEAGVSAVIAPSFARIYYRNAINSGLALLENSQVPQHVNHGDQLSVDFEKGIILTSDGKEFRFPPLPTEVIEIVKAGGLIPYLQKTLKE